MSNQSSEGIHLYTKPEYFNVVDSRSISDKVAEVVSEYANLIGIVSKCPGCLESYKKSMKAKMVNSNKGYP